MYKARWLAPVSSSRRRALEEFEFSEVPEVEEPHRELQPGGGSGPPSDDIFAGLFGGGGNSGGGPGSQSATDAVPIVNTQSDVNSLICNIMRS